MSMDIGSINAKVGVESVRELTPAQQASSDIEKSVMHLAETVHLLKKRLDHVLRPEGPTSDDNMRLDAPPDSAHTSALRRHSVEIAAVRRTVEDILERLDV